MTALALVSTSGNSVMKNKASALLTKEENDIVFKHLGIKCQALATAVVQVYLSEPPYHTKWNKRYCGAACFIRDAQRRSYFIRLFCMDRFDFIWEQELYIQFKYRTPKPFFHTFEADSCQAGLNFADETEAANFKNAVEEKLRQKEERQRRNRAVRRRQHSSSVPNGSVGHVISSPSLIHKPKEKRRKDKSRKFTKADIGIPTNFKHVSHVGWDPNRGLDLRIDPQLRQFFTIAGVSESQLNDTDTRDFIYDFIDKNGGVEAAIRDVHVTCNEVNLGNLPSNSQPPPVPARLPPTPQAGRALPPTPPSRAAAVPPPVPSAGIPPPPPPPPPTRSPHLHPHHNKSHVPPPPPTVPPLHTVATSTVVHTPLPPPPLPTVPPVGGPPPPSQMPPVGGSVPPPPPPPMPPIGGPPTHDPQIPVQQNTHSALMESIRGGKTLKHVEDEPRRIGGDSRGDLLNEIRTGIQLKPVEEQTPTPPIATENLGLAGALARALANRAHAIHSSDSGEEEEEDTDDEWDD